MVARESKNDKISDVQQLVGNLLQYAREAARNGEPIHEVEREIWVRVLSLGHEILAQFIGEQGDGDLGETLVLPDGRELKRLELLHDRTSLDRLHPIGIPEAEQVADSLRLNGFAYCVPRRSPLASELKMRLRRKRSRARGI